MSPITLLKKKSLFKEKPELGIEHDLLTDKEVWDQIKSFFFDLKNRIIYSFLVLFFVALIAVFSYFANFQQFYDNVSKYPTISEKVFAVLLFFTLLSFCFLLIYEIIQFLFPVKIDILVLMIIFILFSLANVLTTTHFFLLQFLWQNNIQTIEGSNISLIYNLLREIVSFNLIVFFLCLFLTIAVIICYGYKQNQLNNKLFLVTIFVLFFILFFKVILFISLVLGFLSFIFVLFLPFISDTSSLLFGRFFGEKKIFPNISPNKTVVGSLSGLFFSLLFGFLYITLLRNFVSSSYINNNLHSYSMGVFYLLKHLTVGWYFALLSFILFFSFLIQFGDFLFSCFKRACFAKNFSNLLGEHGGFLDRFDSLFFLVLFYFLFFNLIS